LVLFLSAIEGKRMAARAAEKANKASQPAE